MKVGYNRFLKNESGVYGIMTALFSFGLIAYVAFVVDGTGILLDKARLNQGVEQAGLFVTAVDENTLQKQPQGVKQMISKVAHSYYRRDMADVKNAPDARGFDFGCGDAPSDDPSIDKQHLGCWVEGYFHRPSWLYLGKKFKGNYGATFDEKVKIGSDKLFFFKKRKKRIYYPMDVIFVPSLASSMKERLGQKTKIDMLRNAIETITSELLDKKNHLGNPLNRLGVVGFSWGAERKYNYGRNSDTYCYLPYLYDVSDSELGLVSQLKDFLKKSGAPAFLENFAKKAKLGYLEDWPKIRRKTSSDSSCLYTYKPISGTSLNYDNGKYQWLDRSDIRKKLNFISMIQNFDGSGERVAASGVLTATNIMMNNLGDAIEYDDDGRKVTLMSQRKMIVISDGPDFAQFTERLIRDGAMCHVIRTRLNEFGNKKADATGKPEGEFMNDIYFINLGGNDNFLRRRWQDCVGSDKYFDVYNKNDLVNALREIVKSRYEEVGGDDVYDEVGQAVENRKNKGN